MSTFTVISLVVGGVLVFLISWRLGHRPWAALTVLGLLCVAALGPAIWISLTP